ncbi:hypothetical protein O6H91_13G061500 [Diphasiastrum complanatum]|uniref:Uncharacterized protein n=2 Tax=Diphasiastrum complanatum TaxID=34168 RepID=A0ACC2BWH4_DIPCM|nr:hypothetical protein O6H91_13G061500 [Diphasiastrum complanatum]KAJ7533733.1 hypothetical protein O6H91_13G061500 [Diphasiastrum complanatum]
MPRERFQVEFGNTHLTNRCFRSRDLQVHEIVLDKNWLKGGCVGISIAPFTLFLLLLIFLAATCSYKLRKKFRLSKKQGVMHLPLRQAVKNLPEQEEKELQSVNIQQFLLQDLRDATQNFCAMIGEGGFGIVYHGNLADGQQIAIKVRSASSIQGAREFATELRLLSDIRHENLVPLLGFCAAEQQQILVYPYMSNGSLQDRLYGKASLRKPLDWQSRLSIALGAAQGLHYLHTGGHRCIIHRDIKSSNILLDDRMVAKVADFGFSKYDPQEGDSIASVEVRGTTGYLDPEYYITQKLTVKSDVFSFGVVLFEIICGREPLNMHRPRVEWSLTEWARPFILNSNIQAVVDPAISSSYTPEAMWRVLEIALSSVEHHAARRPNMSDIIGELEDALFIENNASQYMASIESIGSGFRSSSSFKMPVPSSLASQFPSVNSFTEV